MYRLVMLFAMSLVLAISFTGQRVNADDAEDRLDQVLLEVDDTCEQHIKRAERFIREERWNHAINSLKAAMKAKEAAGTYYPVDKELYVGVEDYCRRLFNTFSPEGMKLVRETFDPEAEAILERGRKSEAFIQALIRVSREYYFTSSGDEALWQLGDYYMEKGRFEQALNCFIGVENHPDRDIPREEVTAKKCMAMLFLGKKTEVEKIADQLEKDKNENTIELDMERVKLSVFLRRRIADINGGAVLNRGAEHGWPMFGGEFDNSRIMGPAVNPEAMRWRYTLQGKHAADLAMRTRRGNINPFFPATVDGVVYLTTANGIIALDLFTGKFIGEYSSDTAGKAYDNGWIQSNHSNLVTCYGGNVYGVTDWNLKQVNAGDFRGAFVVYHNKLVCLNQKSMKFVWETGYDKTKDADFILNRSYFVGAPVIYGGNLYIEAMVYLGSPESHLVCLDNSTGIFKYSVKLCSNSWNDSDPRFGRSPFIPANNSMIAVGDGSLYVSTNAGAIFNIEPETGNVRWARKYNPTVPNNAELQQFGRTWVGLKEWQTSAPVLHSGRLYVAPQNGAYLYALDCETGKVVWNYERETGEDYLLGIANGVLVLGGKSATGLDINTGKLLWRWDGGDEHPSGRGALTDGIAYLPFKDGVRRIAVRNGKEFDFWKWPGNSPEGGNIIMSDKMLVLSCGGIITGISGKEFEVPEMALKAVVRPPLIDIDPKLPEDVKKILALINDLTKDDWAARENATQELIKLGGAGIPHMIKFLKTDDRELSWRLEKILHTLNWMTPEALARKTKELTGQLADMNWQIVEQAKREILKYKAQVLPLLVETMVKEHYDINRNILDILPQFGDEGIETLVNALERFSEKGDIVMRSYARDALEKATGQTFKSFQVDKWREWWNEEKKKRDSAEK